MTLADLLLIVIVAASAAILTTVMVRALHGRFAGAARISAFWAAGVAIYLVAGIGVSRFRAQRVIAPGQAWCFDDWCLTVAAVQQIPSDRGTRLATDLVISSRAKRVTQRARGAWVYVIDSLGRRFAPEADPAAVPLDVALAPGQADTTTRVFDLPRGVTAVGLVTGHGGPYCGVMNILVIGESGCLFDRPTMIRLR